jgi:hypothetical protein
MHSPCKALYNACILSQARWLNSERVCSSYQKFIAKDSKRGDAFYTRKIMTRRQIYVEKYPTVFQVH